MNAVEANAIEKVLLNRANDVVLLTYSTICKTQMILLYGKWFSVKYFIRHHVIPSWLIPTRGYGINGEYSSLRKNRGGFESRYLHQWEREIVAD